MPIPKPNIYCSGNYISSIDALDFIDYWSTLTKEGKKEIAKTPAKIDRLNQVTESDNPIILSYRFK